MTPPRYTIVLAGIMGLLVIYPFLHLCWSKHPVGIHEWDWISNWAGTTEAMSFGAEQWQWYTTMSGRYTSNALLSLTDQWYTLERFQALFAANLLLLWAGTVALLWQVLPALPRRVSLVAATALLACYLGALTNVYESLYRYTVVLIYQTGLLGCVGVAIGLRRIHDGRARPVEYGLTALLLVFTAGTNEISLCLLFLLAGASLLTFYRQERRPSPLYWLLPLVLLAAAVVAVAAPGNFARMDTMAVRLDAGRALVLSLGITAYLWLKWLVGTPLLLLLAPAAWATVRWKGPLREAGPWAYPGLWYAFTVLLVPAVFFPFLYASGAVAFPERIVDLLFYAFQLAFWGSVISTALRYADQLRALQDLPVWRALALVLALAAGLQLLVGGLSFDRRQPAAPRAHLDRIGLDANIGQAWLTLLRGDAAAYDRAMHHQYRQVRACPGDTCYVDRPATLPPQLYDPVYDRKDKNGEPFMGWALHQRRQLIRYRPGE